MFTVARILKLADGGLFATADQFDLAVRAVNQDLKKLVTKKIRVGIQQGERRILPEDQKLLTFPTDQDYTVYPVSWETYFLVNRVENQKLNQTTAELPFG